jgi:hypothetical protein
MQHDHIDDAGVFLHIVADSPLMSIETAKYWQGEVHKYCCVLTEKTRLQARLRECIKHRIEAMTTEKNSDRKEEDENFQVETSSSCPSSSLHESCCNEHNSIECQYLSFDWSRIAFLHSLLGKDDDEICHDVGGQLRHVQGFEVTVENDEDVPTCTLVAREWWDRPVWAWTLEETHLVHGTLAAMDFLRNLNRKGFPHEDVYGKTILTNTMDCQEIFRIIPLQRHNNHNTEVTMIYSKLPRPILQVVGSNHAFAAFGAAAAIPVSQDIDEDSWTDTAAGNGLGQRRQELGSVNDDGIGDECEKFMHGGACDVDVAPPPEDIASPQSTPIKLDGTSIIQQTTNLDTLNTIASLQNVAVLTPSPTAAPLEKKHPATTQIDSTGLDLTILSQLPPNIRAEARLVMALASRDERQQQQRQTISQNPVFERWLSGTATAVDSGNSGKRMRNHVKFSPVKTQGKAKKGIQRYFQEKK